MANGRRKKRENDGEKELTFDKAYDFAVEEMGLNPDYFWSLTYAEFYSMYKGYKKRSREKLNDTITLAWFVERFRRDPDKLKDLTEYLIVENKKPEKPVEVMPDLAIFHMLRAINAALGGVEVVTDPCKDNKP
jgi:hypothetical protein